MKYVAGSFALALMLSFGTAFAADEHTHSHATTASLGTVNFPSGCNGVDAEFTRAVALLHSFGYEESRRAFNAVIAKDAKCAMAYWGIAMTFYHPLWAAPTPQEFADGAAAAQRAAQLAPDSAQVAPAAPRVAPATALVAPATLRERGYIAAIGAFYRDAERQSHGVRAQAYSEAMHRLADELPNDHEAQIFYALSLLGAAPPDDTTFANQKKAAAILNALLPLEPQHPGIAHYMIHSFDYPQLAADALPAAHAYSRIAPDSPHALHMPSHIFTRLGLWNDSVASNLASAASARALVAQRHPGATAMDTLHALDYLEYAYLQIGDEASARQVLAEAAAAKTFDQGAFQAGYALAAIPARYALERRDWSAAAQLEPSNAALPWERFVYASATTYFAQAIGAARSDQLDRARAALRQLDTIHAALQKTPVPGPYDWTGQVESTRLAATAWLDYAEGRRDDALAHARAAADLAELTGKHPVTPGAILPARELLGDLLLEMQQPAAALAEYEAALREAPNRFNSLYGAARAAALSNNPTRAAELYAALLAQCVAQSPRPELTQARKAVSG